MALFNKPLTFEKEASTWEVPQEPSQWTPAIHEALISQHPYLSGYRIEIKITKQRPELGYGVGNIIVQIPVKNPGTQSPAITFPIFISKWQLAPFDVLVRGSETYPASASRVQELLFSPETFTGTSPREETVVNLLNMTSPPFSATVPSFSKIGSGDLLPLILKTASAEDLVKAKTAFEDFQTATAYRTNGLGRFMELVQEAVPLLGTAQEKLATALSSDYTVCQVVQTDEGLVARWANHNAFRMSAEVVKTAAEQAAEAQKDPKTPPKKAPAPEEAMEVEDPTVEEEPQEPTLQEVDSPGVWELLLPDGNTSRGFVVTKVLDLDGAPTERALAFLENGIAFQTPMYGVKVSDDITVPDMGVNPSLPNMSVFWWQDPESGVGCIEPMKLTKAVNETTGGPNGFVAELIRPMSGPVHLVEGPSNLRTVVNTGDSYMIPSWITRAEVPAQMVILAKDPSVASPPQEQTVTVSGSKDSYQVEGSPVGGIPKQAREGCSFDDAMFYLGAAGVGTKLASATLHRVDLGYTQTLWPCRTVLPVPEMEIPQYASIEPVNLLKEAAVLPDASTVDSVLSLGFIAPHNIPLFLAALPKLEESARKLAELLIAVRVGLGLPEAAVRRAMQETERVIQDLKKLGVKNSETSV